MESPFRLKPAYYIPIILFLTLAPSQLSKPLPAVAQASALDLRNQLGDTDRKAAEAHSDIQNFDDQIAKIQAQIADTQTRIGGVNNQISETEARMADKKAILKEYLQTEYKTSQASDLEILVGSKSLADFFDKEHYVETSRDKISATIAEIMKIKKELDAQKAELSKLQTQLIDAQNGLNFQKSLKMNELAGIEAARAALKQKLSAFRNQGMPFPGERVRKGEVIGYEGTSGCSTGTHVHFEVDASGRPVNPRNYLGRLRAPHDSYIVTQEFGSPNWAAPYSFHTGMDMSEYFGAPVMAAADGVVVFSGYDRSGFGDHVIIDHGGGLQTLYGHLGSRGSDYPNC